MPFLRNGLPGIKIIPGCPDRQQLGLTSLGSGLITRREEWHPGGQQRERYGHSGRSGWQGGASPSAWRRGFPPLMAHLVKPLAVRGPLVAVPPGGDTGSDALLQQHGADFVAVVPPLVSHQGSCPWQIPQQEVSASEVAALPFTEVKPYRTPLPVAHHVQLAGQSSFGATNQARGSTPFLRLEALRWALT